MHARLPTAVLCSVDTAEESAVANALGKKIPQSVLIGADRVIE